MARDPFNSDEIYEDDAPDESTPNSWKSENAPADLTDIPTSSTNALRPRTVAAGYDADRKVLTVIFREGKVWNYFDVSEGQWQAFHASISKGIGWINAGVFGKGQEADLDSDGLDPRIYESLSNIARQESALNRTKRMYKTYKGEKLYRGAATPRVSKTSVKKMPSAYTLRAADAKLGTNPATANKPHRAHKPRKK